MNNKQKPDRSKAARRPSAALNLRRQAAAMLTAIEQGKTLDEATDHLRKLEPRDHAQARSIVLACLRHRGEIQALMNHALSKPIPARPHLARALLQVGLAQLCFLDMADHAAVNETVNACGRAEQAYRGLIHAVLRRIQRERPKTDPAQNLPDWLQERWQSAYGADITSAMAKCISERPPLDLCFAREDMADRWHTTYGADLSAQRLAPQTIRLPDAGRVELLPEYEQGIWWVQDFAAQMAARGFSSPGEALDLCAAPGGKTLQLASAGHAVTALDISANRLARLRANLERCQQSASIIQADVIDWSPNQQWSRVLLDAPCSATGTLRRHPDIALHRRPRDIEARAHLQRELLDRAYSLTAIGGELIYCVCSLEVEEGEQQAQAFSARQETARLLPYAPHELPAALAAAILEDGTMRIRPDLLSGGVDGFFIARWQRLS